MLIFLKRHEILDTQTSVPIIEEDGHGMEPDELVQDDSQGDEPDQTLPYMLGDDRYRMCLGMIPFLSLIVTLQVTMRTSV